MPPRIESTLISPFEMFSLGQNDKSSVEEELFGEIPMTKPDLNPNPMFRYLKINTETVQVAENMMEYNINAIEEHRALLETLRTEQIERLQESLKTEEFSDFWSILAKIGSMVLAAISTVAGIFYMSSGMQILFEGVMTAFGIMSIAAGGAMVASGVLSIANLTLEESGGWDWIADKLAAENEEYRKNLRILLPAAVGAVCAITSLGSTFFHWETMDGASKFITIAQTAANFVAAATTASKGFHYAQVSCTEAERTKLSREIFQKEECIEELLNRFMFCQKNIRKELDSAARIITLQSQDR